MVGAEAVLPAPDRVRAVPEGRVLEREHRRRVETVVELGDLEQLEADRGAAAVAGEEREPRGEAPPALWPAIARRAGSTPSEAALEAVQTRAA
ncbi:MAG: hypothetical protein R3E53_09280 [Myxococcota bacterium]